MEQDTLRSNLEKLALEHDRTLPVYPREPEDHNGELDWDLSEAKLLLREDLKSGGLTSLPPAALHASRPEYLMFPARKFKEHVYQEIKRQKFIFWLELKRQEQLKKSRPRQSVKLELI